MHVKIESTDHEGRGIARHEGKVIFVRDTLPGEVADIEIIKRNKSYDQAVAKKLLRGAATRTTPACVNFARCGGCSLQHADAGAQVAFKQRVMEDTLRHIGNVSPGTILPAIQGPPGGYRHRARLSVRYVAKKGGVLVGFHERHSRYITEMFGCEILPPRVSALIPRLRALIGLLSVRDALPQIEITLCEAADILVLRLLASLTEADKDLLKVFADEHRVQLYLQANSPDSAKLFYPDAPPKAYYTLPEFGLTLCFLPTQFTQVNPAINRVLVRRAISLLRPQPGERIADLFCGIGNFALPLAKRGAEVVGIDGNRGIIAQARENADRNHLAVKFVQANLFTITPPEFGQWGLFDKLLIDPPREGALQVLRSLSPPLPKSILYVSCNPATLARDAGFLVHSLGYNFACAGVLNMFPHTAHVESIALFELPLA